MKILSRLKTQAKNRDQAIKEFISLEVVERITDGSLQDIVRDLYFKLSKNLDWEKALEDVLYHRPDLILKLKDYKIESSNKKFVAVHEDYGYEIDSDEDLKKLQERLDERGKDDYIIREIV